MRHIQRKTCAGCGNHYGDVGYEIVKVIDSIGRDHYQVQCNLCWLVSSWSIKKKDVPDAVKSGSPLFVSTEDRTGECEHCGKRGYVESHHWAPKKLFGKAADKWPRSYLCRPCHELWHQKVTGDLVRDKQTEEVD